MRGGTSTAVKCIEYSALMGAKVLSNSWAGPVYSQALKDAIEAAGRADILFVAAAGNGFGQDSDYVPVYPASYDSNNIVAVLSTDQSDELSVFSNYGAKSVDIGAPGSNIFSCAPAGGYQYRDGTSMATPHVAGACALLWSINPLVVSSEIQCPALNIQH